MRVTSEWQKVDIIVISESNMEVNNDIKVAERKSNFTNYDFVDKIIGNNDKARITLMVEKEITF